MNQQSPSTAVATRDNQQIAEKPAPLPLAVRAELERRATDLALDLPGHSDPAAFINIVTRAIAETPELAMCTKRSLVTAAMKAAADGLVPDGREGAFVAYRAKASKKGEPDRWEDRAQWMPMVYGLIKKVRQSGEVESLTAHVAYENDEFDYELGDDERIVHRPAFKDRGQPLCAYAIAKLKNGEIIREVVDLDDLNKMRAASKGGDSQYSPWSKWWSEMARKSAVRRLTKYLPQSKEVQGVIRHDDENYDLARLDVERRQPVTAAQIQQQAAGTLAAPINPGDVTDVDPEGDGAPPVVSLLDENGDVILETEDPDAWVTAYCGRLGQFEDIDAGDAFVRANADTAQMIIGEWLEEGARDRVIEAQNAMRDRLTVADTEDRGEQTLAGDAATEAEADETVEHDRSTAAYWVAAINQGMTPQAVEGTHRLWYGEWYQKMSADDRRRVTTAKNQRLQELAGG